MFEVTNKLNAPLGAYLQISTKNNKPALELRRNLTDPQLIKILISCAFNKQPIIVMPSFSNELQAIASLIEKGIIYLNKEEKKYIFNF